MAVVCPVVVVDVLLVSFHCHRYKTAVISIICDCER